MATEYENNFAPAGDYAVALNPQERQAAKEIIRMAEQGEFFKPGQPLDIYSPFN